MRPGFVLSVAVLSVGCVAEDAPAPLTWTEAFVALDPVPAPVDSAGDSSLFGSINAVVALGGDRLVVVDGMNRVVRLLRDGVEVHRTGGSGDGPNEFRMIRRAVSVGQDSVLILDESRARIAILRAGNDSLEWAGDTLIPFPAQDICALGGHLFLAGSYESLILHEASLEGEIKRSFGPPEGEDYLGQALSGVGNLACSSENSALAFASQTLGIVRIFTPDGREIRRDSIPGFVRTVYEVSGNVMRPALPEEGFAHTVAGMQWLGQDLLVQLSRGRRADGIGRETRLWRADGTWREDLPEWPWIVAVQSDTSLVAAVEDPYPRLLTFRVR